MKILFRIPFTIYYVSIVGVIDNKTLRTEKYLCLTVRECVNFDKNIYCDKEISGKNLY